MLIINKKRIYNIEKYLDHLKDETLIIGVSNLQSHEETISKLGFSSNLVLGETLFPNPNIGPISNFNANGKFIKNKNLPMETCYRTQEFEWKDWHDNYYSRLVDIPYKRYPREFVKPPCIELTICNSTSTGKIICSERITNNISSKTKLLHIINLFLEIFGICEIYSENLEVLHRPEIRKLNWEILPVGDRPWNATNKNILIKIKLTDSKKNKFARDRVNILTKAKPSFIAYGINGFTGYLVFSYKGRYVLESFSYGNATYILGDNWEQISQLTKAEIINNNLNQERIIHNKEWEAKINKYIN